MSPKQTCDAKIAHTTISYDPYQTRATHTQQKTSAQSSRPAHPTFPRRANNMNNHQTLTPAPREHDSAPPPLPHDPKHNATHIDLRTTWQHTAFPAPRNILQAPNATQRRTVLRRSPNSSRTGPSVREHHAKLPRIMASARPVRLPTRAPRNRSTTRHNKPTHATAPTKHTCVSTTRVPQHYQRYCDAMPILLADTSNVRTTHMLTYLYPVYTTRMITHIATLSITHLL